MHTVKNIFNYWKKYKIKSKTKLTAQRISLIKTALNNGYNEDDLKLIIDFAFRSDDNRARFWRGENENQKEYIDIINLFRTNKLKEKFNIALTWHEKTYQPEDYYGPWRLQ